MKGPVPDGIIPAVRQLTDLGVTRLEQLEVLLAMSRQPQRAWDAQAVASTPMLSHTAVADAFTHLVKHHLVAVVPDKPACHRLGERADVALLTLLCKEYERDRTAVTHAFFTCNLDSLRSFASAFRIRRPQK